MSNEKPLTKKQAKIAAQMWAGDLLEAMADNVVDCVSLRDPSRPIVIERDLAGMCKAVFDIGSKIRGDRPRRLTVSELVEYVKNNVK